MKEILGSWRGLFENFDTKINFLKINELLNLAKINFFKNKCDSIFD